VASRKESANSFINRAIDETIARDMQHNANTIDEPKTFIVEATEEQPVTNTEQGLFHFGVKSLYTELQRGYEIDPEAMNFGGNMLSHFKASGGDLTNEQYQSSYDGVKVMKMLAANPHDGELSIEWLTPFIVGDE